MRLESQLSRMNCQTFSTDYPHWDFDDPQHVFKFKAADENKALVFRDNAKALYGLQ